MMLDFHITMAEIIERLEDDNRLIGRNNDDDMFLQELKIDLECIYEMKREIDEAAGGVPQRDSFGH